jgi:hypothetical protein
MPLLFVYFRVSVQEEEKGEERKEEEEDEDEDEGGPRSDLSHDYHPNRTSNYVLDEEGYDDEEAEEWMIGRYNISGFVEGFHDLSIKAPPKKMSNMRLP